MYEFVFYEENDFSERRVVVDRRIPLRMIPPGSYILCNGVELEGACFHYCRSSTPGELWPCLLEKAFAKLYGGYAALDGGASAIGVANLVRGVPYTYKFGSQVVLDSEGLSPTQIAWFRDLSVTLILPR